MRPAPSLSATAPLQRKVKAFQRECRLLQRQWETEATHDHGINLVVVERDKSAPDPWKGGPYGLESDW